MVISDASGLDGSPERLARIFAGDDRVEVVRRDTELNWIEHCNLLLREATTEYFCWMPQDDLVSPEGYFDLLTAALDNNPDRVLAFPTVLRRVSEGRLRRREVEPLAYRRPPIELGRRPPEAEAVDLLRRWNMGLGCWRGVFRSELARAIPETDAAADLIWAFSMALSGYFIEVPEARYLKRLHNGSAHRRMRWQGKQEARRLYEAEVRARIADSPERRAGILNAVDSHLMRHRYVRSTHRVRSAGAFILKGRRPVLE